MVSFKRCSHNERAFFGGAHMKLKQAVTGIAALACMTAAHAQSAGSIYVTSGWFHLAPQSSSQPLTVTSIGGSPTNLSQAGTGATLSSADTIGFTAGYFVTDHIATELVIGVPPSFDLEGGGSLAQRRLGLALRKIDPPPIVGERRHALLGCDFFRYLADCGVGGLHRDFHRGGRNRQTGVLHLPGAVHRLAGRVLGYAGTHVAALSGDLTYSNRPG